MTARLPPTDMRPGICHPAPVRRWARVRGRTGATVASWRRILFARGASAARAVAAALALALAAALALSAMEARATPPSAAKESWFRISIEGTDAGWQRTSEIHDARGVRSASESYLRVGRDGASAEIRIAWEMLESADGVPIECTVEQQSGSAPTRTRAQFSPDGVSARTSAGARDTVQRLPALPADCLGPAAAARRIQAQRAAGSARISITTIDPASGLGPVGIVTVPAPGERCWSTTTTIMPAALTECLDDAGEVIRAHAQLGIGAFTLTRMDRASAQAPLPGGGVDVLRRSVVGVSPPADGLLRAQRAAVTVRARTGTLLPLPSAGAQRVERAADGASARVTVDAALGSVPAEGDAADPRYRGPSPVVDSEDPEVRDAALRTVATVTGGDAARADALRAFVHRHITGKDLASVFASASSVMRSRSGDCTEHAVLLAAMLRAAGIPSRLAAGVVYAREFAGVRGCYAWHMWTQALIDGQWRDLDATLADRPFHAGHILVATGAQDGPSIDPVFAGMVVSVGNLSIAVESVDGVPCAKAAGP